MQAGPDSPQGKGRMTAAVVKLNTLANAVWPPTEDEHLRIRRLIAYTITRCNGKCAPRWHVHVPAALISPIKPLWVTGITQKREAVD
jgi:hypothetical protein